MVSGESVKVVPLPTSGAITLGRGEDCQVRIDNRSVSRHHAVLHVGPPLYIQDLGSANGTFVRDARSPLDTAVTQPLRKLSREMVELSVGERLSLGSVPIAVRRAVADPVGAASPDAAPNSDAAVVRDPAMLAIHQQLRRAARSQLSVLLLGETGVGKEVLARLVHDSSPRAQRPLLELNCAALPPSLLEGELFGHEKNAFTGAAAARPGLLEAADGGTVFLDEIGELPLPVQIKLLRVLEDRKVMRLGGRAARTLDVRFVAATNRDLEAEIVRGTFRQDLYFRINGATFMIPPLRERVVEIAPLAERFLAAAGRAMQRAQPLRLSSEALGYLERHAWPGNVRELRNVIERAAVLADGDVIEPADLPAHLTGAARAPLATSRPPTVEAAPPLRAAVGAEPARSPSPHPDPRQQILDALEQCAGNQTRAAKLLGISLRTLVNRLSAYDIPRPRRDRPA